MFIGEIVAVYANEDCVDNGRSNVLKAKPTVLMDTGYFELNNRVESIFKVCSSNKKGNH